MGTTTRVVTYDDAPSGQEYRPIAPVEPTNIRPLLFLDMARAMMLDNDWPYRAVTVTMESHAMAGRFAFYGANHINSLKAVQDREIDISILNPSAILTMAHLGAGAFDSKHQVATIATIPHADQLGFAVSEKLGFGSLDDIAAARYPLRLSTRGSLDSCTQASVDVVLRAHGFSLEDIKSWGGEVVYDQPMPPHPDRIGRLASGEIEAIFDEGVFIWVDKLKERGAVLLPLAEEKVAFLETQGFRRGLIEKARYPTLSQDVLTVDYGGWPIYCRADTPDDLVTRFCNSLIEKRDQIVWEIGVFEQPGLPLEQMVKDSPSTPMDVPLHPAAAAVWGAQGWL